MIPDARLRGLNEMPISPEQETNKRTKQAAMPR
jgi:hypothetical protein